MSIQKDIRELIDAGIITPETAQKIADYYQKKNSSASNRLFMAFGILGAILVSLGIILIIAHNWDALSRTTKTVFAFLPLVMTQLLYAYVLLKKSDSKTWVESATTLLFFAIGACIALISQIYHIPGNLNSFLLIWMLLALPLMYVMKSSMAPLLYIVGITYYAAETSYFSFPSTTSYAYWGLLLAVLPQYFSAIRSHPNSNFTSVENWLVPLSITIALGTLGSGAGFLLYIAYFSLFGLFCSIGNNRFFKDHKLINNPYRVFGTIGTVILLFISSSKRFWEAVADQGADLENWMSYVIFWVGLGISLIAMIYLLQQQSNKSIRELPIFAPVFIVFLILFGIGQYTSSVWILIDVMILVVSMLTIISGSKKEHLGILNFGLAVITCWIIIRFLNTDLSFVIRGLLLVAIGVGFFMANYWMLKKRKSHG